MPCLAKNRRSASSLHDIHCLKIHCKVHLFICSLCMLLEHFVSLITIQQRWLTFCHASLSWILLVAKNAVFPRLKFFLNRSDIFGCSFLIILVCCTAAPPRIMFVLKSLNFFEYNCCKQDRWPIGRSVKCTSDTFNTFIILGSTHSPCV
jgi:hypothetical protein